LSRPSRVLLPPARMIAAVAGPEVIAAIDSWVKSVYAAFGVDVNAAIVIWAWNQEDFAGNPLHLLLIVMTIAALAIVRRTRRPGVVELAAIPMAGTLLTVLLVSPAITIVGVRLQLPLFVLWAPVFAAVAAALLPRAAQLAAALILVLLAVPWLLFNNTRPAIGLRPGAEALSLPCSALLGCTANGSVFVESPENLAFAAVRPLQAGLIDATQALGETSCTSVGLRIDSSDPEYLIWWLLDAPQSGYHLETIYTSPDLEPLIYRDFEPCAILCTVCGGRTRLHGLDLALEQGAVKLFVGDGFTWDEDG